MRKGANFPQLTLHMLFFRFEPSAPPMKLSISRKVFMTMLSIAAHPLSPSRSKIMGYGWTTRRTLTSSKNVYLGIMTLSSLMNSTD